MVDGGEGGALSRSCGRVGYRAVGGECGLLAALRLCTVTACVAPHGPGTMNIWMRRMGRNTLLHLRRTVHTVCYSFAPPPLAHVLAVHTKHVRRTLRRETKGQALCSPPPRGRRPLRPPLHFTPPPPTQSRVPATSVPPHPPVLPHPHTYAIVCNLRCSFSRVARPPGSSSHPSPPPSFSLTQTPAAAAPTAA